MVQTARRGNKQVGGLHSVKAISGTASLRAMNSARGWKVCLSTRKTAAILRTIWFSFPIPWQNCVPHCLNL